MDFEREILMILKEVGPTGMPLRRIALNVFNMKNSFFYPLQQAEVYEDVAEWLRQKVNQSGSPIMKAETRGWYRLNLDSAQVQQLMLEFTPSEDDEWML